MYVRNVPARWLLVAAALGAGLFCGSIREDELDCEEAVARLRSCCPGFSPDAVDCRYREGCGPVYPQISTADSDCIRATACETLVATGVCERRSCP
jgi:hypothetical protein